MLSLPECHNGGKRHSVQQSERELGGTGNPQVLGVSHIQRDHKPQAHGAPNSRGARVKTAQVHRVPNSTDQPRVRNSTDQPRSMECPIPQTSPGPCQFHRPAQSAQFHRPAQVHANSIDQPRVPNSTDQPRSMECCDQQRERVVSSELTSTLLQDPWSAQFQVCPGP